MTARASRPSAFSARAPRRGSVLIIVLWTCLGLVALTLYFAHAMSSELRAADNRVTEVEARQAVAGGIRYAGYILANFAANGAVPHVADYKAEALPVGEAQFWLIGRDPNVPPTSEPVFGLVDEASKLNLRTASRAMLTELPNMTPELVEAIIGWRRATSADTGDEADSGGASDNVYARLEPPRLNKGAPFESVDELRLVDGATLDLLFGEDTNRNGARDANEDDGEASAPRDNQDGQLLAGILEYVTVYSRQPNTRADGTRRINVANANGQNRQRLIGLMVQKGIEPQRAGGIVNTAFGPAAGPGGGPGGGPPGRPDFTSVAEFMIASQMTADEFVLIHADITVQASGATQQGLINVNTASEAVLACIPGIGPDNAATLAAYRAAHPDVLTSFAWLTQVLTPADIRRAGRYITDQSYQFTADVAAVGRFGRGYCREKVIFDTRTGTPRIIFHQDLGAYGWALGAQVRQTLNGTNTSS